MNSKKQIKSALESMMFVWGEPLEIKVCAEMFDMSKEDMTALFLELADEYEQEGRGIAIRQVNKGFQFVTRPENGEFIERLCRPVKVKKLSQSALEVLAIIAYKQPVTKGEIDAIRGIKCDRVVDGLLKKDLICVKGRSEGVGRPMLYGTTDAFLKQFGFATLKELPEIEDIEGVIGVNAGSAVDFEDADGVVDDGLEQISIEGIDMSGGGAEVADADSVKAGPGGGGLEPETVDGAGAGGADTANTDETVETVDTVETAETADEVEPSAADETAETVEIAETAETAETADMAETTEEV